MKMILIGEFIAGITLSFIGLVFNVAEVTLLSLQKTKRTKYQNLILSLSSADICTSLFFLSSFICQRAFHDSEMTRSVGLIIFVIAQELLWFSVTSSLLHVLAISFDRLLAIRFPMKHRFWFTNRINKGLIIVTWLLSFLFLLPSFIVYHFLPHNVVVKMMISSLVLTAGVLIIILYAYIIRKTVSKECIFEIITLKSGKKEIVSACSPREKKILMTSVLIVISFLLCSVPFAVKYIVTQSKQYTVLLLLSNSILNPLIYFFQRYYQDKRDETMRRKTRQGPEWQSNQVRAPKATHLSEQKADLEIQSYVPASKGNIEDENL